MVLLSRLQLLHADDLGEHVANAIQRLIAARQLRANLGGAAPARLGPHPLRGIRQHELVAFFDLPAAFPQLVAHVYCLSTTQRCGSWCSRNSCREISPKTMPLVIHSFSGRMAK